MKSTQMNPFFVYAVDRIIIQILNVYDMNVKKILFAGVCLLMAFLTKAQVSQMPQAFSYQAVVRDNTGKVVVEKVIGVKVEILLGSADGQVVYGETHAPKSSQTGTVNLLVGKGTAMQSSFADIDWSIANYFLRISMDLQGGNNYEVVSTTQMLPVPFALYAEKAGNVLSGGVVSNKPKYGQDFMISHADYSYEVGTFLSAFGTGMNAESEFNFDFMINYLTGTDLKLQAKIDNFEPVSSGKGHSNSESRFQSTALGRYCNFKITIPEGELMLKATLSICNEEDEMIISFPLTFIREDY